MENKLYKVYQRRAAEFRWFESLDAESLRVLLLSTWYIMLWNATDVEQKLLKFYGHAIDAPNVSRFLKTLKLRFACCDMYAWAVPNEEALAVLREHSPLIEIGAGRGYWAALASSAGADILAFDPNPPSSSGVNPWHRQPGTYFLVQKADLEIAKQHPDRALFLCWPPFSTDVALRALRAYEGKTVIYVGDEGHDAGTPAFYSELAAHFSKVRVVEIPRWPGIRDRLEVWQRSNGTIPPASA